MHDDLPPILQGKVHDEPSAFTPDSLLREARRQRGLKTEPVPRVCVLDPDGDLVRQLTRQGRSVPDPHWACYHTTLHLAQEQDLTLGIVPCAVGASFAVLVAEELFAAGCELLISVTSSGQLLPQGDPPYFVLIERALRDEGTSYHYEAPAEFAHADPELVAQAAKALGDRAHVGASWTTDAPFRETAEAIEAAKARSILAVEMEAAALYTFAAGRGARVLCLAHVTNTMAQGGNDFEKGEVDGTADALAVLGALVAALSSATAAR